jgi:DNA (cytosine-5)-methyltransferase 1
MNENTLGSICAGIGGFDLGFEQAGWQTRWQIELDPINRAVLAHRFPSAAQFMDLRHWRDYNLAPVKCIAFGFPCQDISTAGQSRQDKSRRGLAGQRSGLFFEIMDCVAALRPQWVVVENVPNLLHINEGRDFQSVLARLAECGYVGYWRVLNAQYFGVPQNRRRLYLVAGLGRQPSLEFLADAAPVDAIPCSFSQGAVIWPADSWAGYTLLASGVGSRISLGSELLIAQADGWNQMAKRTREARLHGFPSGLDDENLAQAYSAGNAVVPQVAKWIAEILNKS